ncbi:hypothetical protein QJS10_CPA06g00782 [Acorus calamus]|uniref:Phytocyanin domain-containing protein n=1 Tax=Acorus calamus TaxID=4465 RepID=A0AAV9EJG8_ACOCL|nr:hypothetical protein QJS10_CPA06g00782 [Acorus calamus]
MASSSSSSSLFGFFFVVVIVIVTGFPASEQRNSRWEMRPVGGSLRRRTSRISTTSGRGRLGFWLETPYNNNENDRQIDSKLLLDFVYNNDSVLAVDKAGYYHCNMSHPYATFNDGNTTIALDRPGIFYFVSGYPDHCKNGQRLIVRVLALHPPSPSPTGGLPPSGAAEPPSPSPSSSSAATSVPVAALGSTFVSLVVAMVVTICVVH